MKRVGTGSAHQNIKCNNNQIDSKCKAKEIFPNSFRTSIQLYKLERNEI